MLASCMQNVGNHASTLLATPAAAPLTMTPLAVQVLIVGTGHRRALTFGPLRRFVVPGSVAAAFCGRRANPCRLKVSDLPGDACLI